MEADASVKVLEGKILVRGMGAAIRGRQGEEKGICPQDFFKGGHDGDRTAFAHEGGRTAKNLLEGAPGRQSVRLVGVHKIGFAAMAGRQV